MYIACTRPGLTSDMLEFLKNKNALFSTDFHEGETALHRAVRTGLYERLQNRAAVRNLGQRTYREKLHWPLQKI